MFSPFRKSWNFTNFISSTNRTITAHTPLSSLPAFHIFLQTQNLFFSFSRIYQPFNFLSSSFCRIKPLNNMPVNINNRSPFNKFQLCRSFIKKSLFILTLINLMLHILKIIPFSRQFLQKLFQISTILTVFSPKILNFHLFYLTISSRIINLTYKK